MKDKIFWLGFLLLFIGLFLFFLYNPQKPQLAGDIVEYYGISETLINHGSLKLKDTDRKQLETALNPGYLADPQYYIKGIDGSRYPVHFIAYSITTIPARLLLRFFGQNELKTFPLTNLILFSFAGFFIMRYFIKSLFSRIIFLIFLYFSPLIYFLIWPGSEIYIASFLLLAVFCFFHKRYTFAIILSTFASWQSQPLILIPILFLILSFYQQNELFLKQEGEYWRINYIRLSGLVLLILLMFIPYFYNFLVFGVVDPWFLLQKVSFWTQQFGFGFHNTSLQKFTELFFDSNIGLFFYAPVLLIAGFYFLVKSLVKKEISLAVLLVLIIINFLYQTNPNWHNGTAGFGPTRYALYLIPFLIYVIVRKFERNTKHFIVLGAYLLTQFWVLSFNGYLLPNFENTLYHSPYAAFVLDNFPSFYNPTPEIFIERTNHIESNNWDTTIYKKDERCNKAYVLLSKSNDLIKECGEGKYLTTSVNYKGHFSYEGFYINY